MSYSGSKAQSGNQTQININTGTPSTPVWTLVGEVIEFTQSGTQNEDEDSTNLQSPAKEFLPTILNPGQMAGTMNRISGDTGQSAIRASFNTVPPTLKQYQVVLPKTLTQVTSGDTFVFTAMVKEFADLDKISPTGIVRTKFNLKVSGAIAYTAGS
jgi:hypothetical protein